MSHSCLVMYLYPFTQTKLCFWSCLFTGGFDLRCFFLGADGTFSVHRWVGVKNPLGQIDECMVSVTDCQALCLEQDAGLPIVRHTQRAIRPHQRLEQLPLTVRHPWLMPVERLQIYEERNSVWANKGKKQKQKLQWTGKQNVGSSSFAFFDCPLEGDQTFTLTHTVRCASFQGLDT